MWAIDHDGPGNVEVTVSGVLVTKSLQGETFKALYWTGTGDLC